MTMRRVGQRDALAVEAEPQCNARQDRAAQRRQSGGGCLGLAKLAVLSAMTFAAGYVGRVTLQRWGEPQICHDPHRPMRNASAYEDVSAALFRCGVDVHLVLEHHRLPDNPLIAMSAVRAMLEVEGRGRFLHEAGRNAGSCELMASGERQDYADHLVNKIFSTPSAPVQMDLGATSDLRCVIDDPRLQVGAVCFYRGGDVLAEMGEGPLVAQMGAAHVTRATRGDCKFTEYGEESFVDVAGVNGKGCPTAGDFDLGRRMSARQPTAQSAQVVALSGRHVDFAQGHLRSGNALVRTVIDPGAQLDPHPTPRDMLTAFPASPRCVEAVEAVARKRPGAVELAVL